MLHRLLFIPLHLPPASQAYILLLLLYIQHGTEGTDGIGAQSQGWVTIVGTLHNNTIDELTLNSVAKPPVVDLTEDNEGRTPATIPQGILPLSDEIISQHANLGADRLRWSDGERWKTSSKEELHLTPSRGVYPSSLSAVVKHI